MPRVGVLFARMRGCSALVLLLLLLLLLLPAGCRWW
jgi:hypothetical protein